MPLDRHAGDDHLRLEGDPLVRAGGAVRRVGITREKAY
jgi:hypothetical protein